MTESDDLFSEYLTWTNTSISELGTLLSKAQENNPVANNELKDDIFGIAHNVKGMGTSFGFPLMTDLGTTLCHYLQNLPENTAVSITVVDAHMKAMQVILDNKIEGDGGEMGRKLKARIDEIIKTHG